MKKGISLIVLVITIIVLAILAAAIIISMSNANVLTEAGNTVEKADLANAKYAVQLEYAAALSRGTAVGAKTGKAYKKDMEPSYAADGTYQEKADSIMEQEDYIQAIADAMNITKSAASAMYEVTVDGLGCPTKVELDVDVATPTTF